MEIFKYIGMSFLGQLLIFIVTTGLISIFERLLPTSISQGCPLTIYCPFYLLMVNLGNWKGESTMIEVPILAIVIGSLFYSLFFGFLYFFYKQYKK